MNYGGYMKFKLFLKVVLLVTAFSGIVQAHGGGRERLSLAEIKERKDLYSQSRSYQNLSPELRSLVNKYAFETQIIGGDSYRLSICPKGSGREKQLCLKCAVSGKMKNIRELLKTDNKFRNWISNEIVPTALQKTAAPVLSMVDRIDYPKRFVVANSKREVYSDSIKKAMSKNAKMPIYVKKSDFAKASELKKVIKTYASSLKGEQQAAKTYSAAWRNYAAECSKSTLSSVAGDAASSMAKAGVPLVKVGASSVAKKAAIPVALGATALAGYYVFKKQPKAEPSYMQRISSFCSNNPGKTAGVIAGTAALAYGAYKLYDSDIFAESKKVSEVQR
jgi:hypothetical protein